MKPHLPYRLVLTSIDSCVIVVSTNIKASFSQTIDSDSLFSLVFIVKVQRSPVEDVIVFGTLYLINSDKVFLGFSFFSKTYPDNSAARYDRYIKALYFAFRPHVRTVRTKIAIKSPNRGTASVVLNESFETIH